MLTKLISRLAALLMPLILVACAAPAPTQNQLMIRQGTIEQLTPVQIQNDANMGVGAIVGGLAGLGIGSMIGAGSGRDVAMVAGTIGGTIAGQEAQRRMQAPIAGQQVFVRLDSGVIVEVTQPTDLSLRVGQRVFVQGNGQDARVIPQ